MTSKAIREEQIAHLRALCRLSWAMGQCSGMDEMSTQIDKMAIEWAERWGLEYGDACPDVEGMCLPELKDWENMSEPPERVRE